MMMTTMICQVPVQKSHPKKKVEKKKTPVKKSQGDTNKAKARRRRLLSPRPVVATLINQHRQRCMAASVSKGVNPSKDCCVDGGMLPPTG
jgi:hypothetical protein